MSIRFDLQADSLRVELTGMDLLMNLTRAVSFERVEVLAASVEDRSDVESMVDRRVLGTGPHSGARRPNRRRVGTMLGRGVDGKQFWAVPAGPGSQHVLVLDLEGHEFKRAVLAVENPRAAVEILTGESPA